MLRTFRHEDSVTFRETRNRWFIRIKKSQTRTPTPHAGFGTLTEQSPQGGRFGEGVNSSRKQLVVSLRDLQVQYILQARMASCLLVSGGCPTPRQYLKFSRG